MLDGDEKSVGLPAGPAASRRRWSEAEKRRIVAESYQPGVSVSVVARRNDVNANLVFNWRRRFREAGVSTAARLCTGAAAQKCTTGIGGSLSP